MGKVGSIPVGYAQRYIPNTARTIPHGKFILFDLLLLYTSAKNTPKTHGI